METCPNCGALSTLIGVECGDLTQEINCIGKMVGNTVLIDRNATKAWRPNMAKSVRRIVTGHNKAGKSVNLMNYQTPNAVSPPAVPQLVNTVLWITDDSPASNQGNEDASPNGRTLGIEPPSRGSVFRVVDFPPDKVFEGIDARKMMEQVGGAHALDKKKARHALFHKTNIVDSAIVLEVEI